MWLHALDISYDGALAPQEREGAGEVAAEEEEEGRKEGGRVERELTASELIHPQSSRRECSSVILFSDGERERERGGGTDREECKPATERMRDREIGAAQQ